MRAYLVLAVAASVVVAVVVAAREVVGPWWASSPALVGAAVVAAACLTVLRAGVAAWPAARVLLACLAAAALAVPGWWALAAMASALVPESLTAWLTAVPAMTAHLPLVAAFSLLPLVCLRYLGVGTSRLAAGVVVGLMAATGLAFAVFFDDFPPPLAADAPLSSSAGEGVGAGVHALFLATVLLGPGAALVAAGRDDSPAGVRLRTVGLASGAGSVLVMACGALVGARETGLPADTAAVVIYVGAFAAVVVAATGTVRALRLPDQGARPAHRVLEPTSTGQESAPGADAVEQPLATTASGDGGTTDPDVRTDAALGVPPLTAREREVLELLALGLSNAGIAAQLMVSQRTVDAHLRSVFTKLDLPEGPTRNRRVLAAKAFAAWAPSDTRVLHRSE